MGFEIKKYSEHDNEQWDKFVMEESMNGTFLQTRKFINYHKPGKFEDHSLVFCKGNAYVAVILGCVIFEEGKKTFYSHGGTSFGGILIKKKYYSTTHVNELFEILENYLKENAFDKCIIKETPCIFEKETTELVDYFYYYKGFAQCSELNFYLDLKDYQEDIFKNFTSGKRRDCRYSFEKGLEFKQIESNMEIEDFHRVLLLNLDKLGLRCVHTTDDLIDLKKNRFNGNIRFYAVYYEGKMIAGSMIFLFGNGVFHTQYLASDEQYLNLFPMDFLIYHLIEEAVRDSKRLFTFGICTEDRGKYLNFGLSRFKEGFGVRYTINKTFEKSFPGNKAE